MRVLVSAATAVGLALLPIGRCAAAGTGTATLDGNEARKEDLEREQAEEFLVMSRRGLATHERFLRSIEQEMQFWKNKLSGDASEELKAYSKKMLREAETTLKEARELHERERQQQEKLEADFKRRFHIDDEE
jgi:hypothetical protein